MNKCYLCEKTLSDIGGVKRFTHTHCINEMKEELRKIKLEKKNKLSPNPRLSDTDISYEFGKDKDVL